VRWLALVGVLAVAGLSACQWDETRFFDLRVLNDTQHPVKIRPCWDQYCLDLNGMPSTVLGPGESKDENTWWPKDFGSTVSVVLLGPTGKRIGCMTTSYPSGQLKRVLRVSQQKPKCPRYRGAGPGG
jgi:hypothetical protein